MIWFLALNESHVFENFAKLVKVAVATAQRYTSLKPHFIYDGQDNELTSWMTKRNVPIIRWKTRFESTLAACSERLKNPFYLSFGRGVFLRVEIPDICREHGIPDDYVLYTDVDVMFQKDVCSTLAPLKPKYFAVAPEFDQRDYSRMNSGVMWMNIQSLRAEQDAFCRYVEKNIDAFVVNAWDQTAYQKYYRRMLFGYRWDHLESEMNWKSYWGESEKARIIHFHGPKPFHREHFQSGNTPKDLQPLLVHATPPYYKLCQVWDNEFALANNV